MQDDDAREDDAREDSVPDEDEVDAHGSFVWNELNSWDVEAAKAFYARVFGWTFEPMEIPMGTYWIASMGEETVGGIFPLSSPEFDGLPAHWLAYVEVDDVDARVALVEEAGGIVLRRPFDVPEVGRIAIVKDAEGAVLGWMTSEA
ncbi:VOC family protein [Bosea sp. 117]|uniref:VOC family protein n=1 Tax=Bosea sp. 117 TaxID=1125973 RepID=UPI000B273BF9|nr:VOC family protein [Bosea sp. 117]